MKEVITLAHGSGGRKTSELIGEIFKKNLGNEYFTADDAAVLPKPEGRIAMSTDGFIVSPWKYPGGNIGRLAICGTVNDLACMGARPLYLTCSYIIEEGLPIEDLELIAKTMGETAREAGVNIVAGDTKVAGKGQVDKIFITTAGVGVINDNINTSGKFAKPGDKIIVTGDVGRHGTAILLARDEYGIEAEVTSDCAPLWEPVRKALEVCPEMHVIRDATRGGVGTVLYEIADEAGVGIKVNRSDVPVAPEVLGVTGLLGLEPLYLACEGRMVMMCPADKAEAVVNVLKETKYTEGATIIGEVTDTEVGRVVMTTEVGGQTYLPKPGNELLPRIC